MARTVFSDSSKTGGGLSLSSKAVLIDRPKARTAMVADPAGGGGSGTGGTGNATGPGGNSDDYQGYLDRIQSYIPAEVIALFILVNSVMGSTDDPVYEGWSYDDMAGVLALIIGLIACFVYAAVAASNDGNPAWRTQAMMWGVAFLIWVYAIDAKVLTAFNIELVPAFSTLLLATFTLASGFVVPSKPKR